MEGQKSYVLAAALLVLALPATVLAWGHDGHQIVALIAQARLTPAAKLEIQNLLDGDSICNYGFANWADRIRPRRPQTGQWHYVEIPLDALTFDEARDGRDGNNVIDKIDDFESILKNPLAARSPHSLQRRMGHIPHQRLSQLQPPRRRSLRSGEPGV